MPDTAVQTKDDNPLIGFSDQDHSPGLMHDKYGKVWKNINFFKKIDCSALTDLLFLATNFCLYV